MQRFSAPVLPCFWRRPLRFLLLFIALTLIPASAYTDSGTANNQISDIKTAFVVNIARFVHWPRQASDNNQLQLCMYRGGEGFQASMPLRGQVIAGRNVHIAYIDELSNVKDCSILVIPGSEVGRFGEDFLPLWRHQPILTILDLTASTQGGSAYAGIMVSLVRKGSKIGFEINLDEVHNAGLKMSSELLKLATLVKGDN